MRVFVTGGTGLIGSAVVAELLGNDHTVLALARSDASALAAEAAGAEPLRGALADLNILRTGVAQADGVIHLAFGNDFSSPDALAKSVAEESAALATLGEELVGATAPSSPSRVRPVRRAASPPRPTRCPPTGRSVVAVARSRRSWAWPRAASAARPYACRARSTTRARAGSPVC
jgi:NAD(P)-dependent dehydrogenase (short-subunit alcohol dehydrogenase family)